MDATEIAQCMDVASFSVSLTQARVSWEEGASGEELPSLACEHDFALRLVTDGCGMALPAVGSATPGTGASGLYKKGIWEAVEKELVSSAHP